ncbi:isoprenoid synthase domain-containing protein [Melampsora americana]|nr:isoprenoid synthase domain-containing protein [Melampsora americana]
MTTKRQSTRDRFLETWPKIKNVLLESAKKEKLPLEAFNWFERNLDYNTPGGKLNRGTAVVDTYKILKGEELSSDEFLNAAALGWCVELLQAYFLVADDMMDQSITRRGQPCYYRLPEVGNIAINDAFMLEGAIYIILKSFFRNHTSYVNLLELLHDVTFQTELGQLIDLLAAPEDNVDLNKFSSEKHRLIVLYKTSFYSFYLPVALAMRMYGMTSPTDPGQLQTHETQSKSDPYHQAMEILLPLGVYFQIQDDYLDCFGDPNVIGKVGTDIVDNKCSWNINTALKYCTADQRKVLDENYGRKNPESEKKVKEIFSAENINLPKRYSEYETETYERLNSLISEIDDSIKGGLKQDVFKTFLAKIHKRSK